jgi:hypothetical protein
VHDALLEADERRADAELDPREADAQVREARLEVHLARGTDEPLARFLRERDRHGGVRAVEQPQARFERWELVRPRRLDRDLCAQQQAESQRHGDHVSHCAKPMRLETIHYFRPLDNCSCSSLVKVYAQKNRRH